MKVNVITDAVDAFFDFISTGSQGVDRFIKRLVSVSLLAWVIMASVSSLGTDVYSAVRTLGNVITVSEEAVDESGLADQFDAGYQEAMALFASSSPSEPQDEVTSDVPKAIDPPVTEETQLVLEEPAPADSKPTE